jgi:hypothetical protein
MCGRRDCTGQRQRAIAAAAAWSRRRQRRRVETGALRSRCFAKAAERAGKLVAIAGVSKKARFEHRVRQLLDEQRHAVGLGDGLPSDLVRQC